MRATSSLHRDAVRQEEKKEFAVNWDDELVKATLLTKDGAIVHPNIKR
jgi:NAD(P) transhydrogenase subunit alpha